MIIGATFIRGDADYIKRHINEFNKNSFKKSTKNSTKKLY